MTILLIDNDCNFRGTLAAALREDGHVVQESGQPSEVSPLDDLGDVSLAIIGHTALRAGRLAFVDAFHRAHPSTPILVLAEYWSLKLAVDAAARPFVRLLRKPIGCEELRCLVRNVDTKRT